MSKIRIMADSTCDLSPELIEKYGIKVLPLNIVMDDTSYLDGVETTPDKIYEWADANRTTPKTSAPGIEAAVEFLRPVAKNGDEICYLGISEQMSATCQVLRLAAEELEYTDHVRVVDSMNLSTGIGLQLLFAAEKAQSGCSLDELEELLKEYRLRVRASFVVDTLTYLQRGGRCSAVTALMGNALKLKPRIAVADGKMGVSKKYRGNQKKTVIDYVKDMEEDLKRAERARVFITHSGIAPGVIDEVKAYLESLQHFDAIYVTRAGGVISSHCGPGTLGVLFVEGK
ncbi:MAG: DegV family protein [Lachnospiraceae bacterium]|nr:DegV family protein [Lachnospiraceae bacterium]